MLFYLGGVFYVHAVLEKHARVRYGEYLVHLMTARGNVQQVDLAVERLSDLYAVAHVIAAVVDL